MLAGVGICLLLPELLPWPLLALLLLGGALYWWRAMRLPWLGAGLFGFAWVGLQATLVLSAQLPPAWEKRDLSIEGRIVKGLTNIGKRPSDDNFDYVSIEAFLLDFNADLYDKSISLEIHVHIRGVIKFNSLEEVKQQVDRDIVSIRTFLDRY